MGLVLVGLIAFSAQMPAYAQEGAGFQSRCENAEALGYPPCADTPAECGTTEINVKNPNFDENGSTNPEENPTSIKKYREPFNCFPILEPIAGRNGYDLFTVTPTPDKTDVIYKLYLGGAIAPGDEGPIQFILTFEKGKETEGPFGLLYNYLGLVYKYMSGIIVAVVVLFIIVAGVRISTAGGNAEGAKGGKDMIIKALVGMVLWFTASVILYTINPTFFAF